MLNFKEIPYTRPTVEEINATKSAQIEKLKDAENFEDFIAVYKEIEDYSYNSVFSMWNLAYIRHSLDTNDVFYKDEKDFWDNAGPEIDGLDNEITKILLESKFRPELEEAWGKLMFLNEEIGLKSFDKKIIEDLKEENQLASEYGRLMASAEVEFEGKTYTLSQLSPLMFDANDREMRMKAYATGNDWRLKNVEQVENIFDKLVTVRANIAEKLGHENFVETGYYRNGRNSYTKEMVENFRESVVKYIVPIVSRLKEEQKNRIGVDVIKPFDEDYMFADGNAKPVGTPEEIFAHARVMYDEMSPSTKEAWNFMQDHDLIDVLTRPGKGGGGYQSAIQSYGAPFIFANFDGTVRDIDVLTHEVGHAWAYYVNRDIFPEKLQYAPDDITEIHSMAMEFLSYPWMEAFFGASTEKYYYTHLAQKLTFLPYGVMVDEFQHHIYENPRMTKNDRNQLWLDLEKKYRPWLNVENVEFDEEGRRWQRQLHIFDAPFYYIDYVLAGIVALIFWAKSRQNYDESWEKYEKLTRMAGTKTFVDLLEDADIPTPFEGENVKLVADEVLKFLSDLKMD